jgi:hypothetical protein
MNKKSALPEVKIGKFKMVKYYQADVTAPDEWFDIIANIGSKVITRDALFNVGANHILTNAVNNKFELESVKNISKKRNKKKK